MISSIACTSQPGAQAAAVRTIPTIAPDVTVQMVVIVDRLNIRAEPSELAAADEHGLRLGDVVTVDVIRVVGDAEWCHHAQGWSACRFLAAVK